MPINIFSSPREIYYGAGAIESVTQILGKRVLIVTDPGVKDQGLADRLGKIVKRQGAALAIFGQVEPDPSRETAGRILSLAQDFQPDLFIGLGGGSSIDAAKAAWVLYENPDWIHLSVIEVAQKILQCVLRKKARLIAIPTTSGTGSEVTKMAVVTDLTRTPPYKSAWSAPQIVPDAAILDPELTVTMPAQITANTGFDALSHAVECYVLTSPSDMVDALAIWSARIICEWLPRAVANGRDLQARDRMHMASLQAGLAFTNGTLGLVHMLAHVIGAEFHIPHGRAIAYVLCPVFAFFYSTRRERLVGLAKALDIQGTDDRAKVQALLNFLNQLKKDIGIPLSIKDTELSETQFFSRLDSVIEGYKTRLGVLDPMMRPILGVPDSIEEVRALLLHAWNGTTADLR
jgi:alcohol dehydrogenase class IV